MEKYGFKEKEGRDVQEAFTDTGRRVAEIELNGLYLEDAKVFIKEELIKLKKKGYELIKFIHGFARGKELRDYVRSDEFKASMKDLDLEISSHSTREEGETIISLK